MNDTCKGDISYQKERYILSWFELFISVVSDTVEKLKSQVLEEEGFKNEEFR